MNTNMYMSKKRHRNSEAEVATSATEEDANLIRTKGTTVYFHADVDTKTIAKFLKCLEEATESALRETHPLREPEVLVYIHSQGGDAWAGLSAMDHMRMLDRRVKLVTVADGIVASAATLMLLAGRERIAMPNSFILIHQLSVEGFMGKYVELVDELKNSTELMNTFRKIYQERTKMTPKRMEQLLKKELVLDANMCLQEGFVQRIA